MILLAAFHCGKRNLGPYSICSMKYAFNNLNPITGIKLN